jgi:GWxTD domain-containing protein
MRRIRGLVPVVFLSALAVCGGWKRVGTEDAKAPSEGLSALLNQQVLFQKLGRLSAGDPLPFTGSVALVKGVGDTVLVILGLSLENRVLSFQKDAAAYVARYRVDATFQPATGRPVSGGQEETVRVDTFQETGRADESVLFQKFFRLLPGTYQLTVTIRDLQSGTINKAELALVVSPFGTATTSAPILTYQVTGRDRLDQSLRIVLNPRGAVAFGGDTLLAYLEGYGYPGPTAVPFEVRTATDSLVYSDSLRFRGGLPVESQFIKLRPDSMALGELRLIVGRKPDQKSLSAVVSFSAAWLVTNFDEMISMLKWFGHQQEVDRLKQAEPAQRPSAWLTFWKETDPNRGTPENEALNSYFGRVAVAAQQFRDEGVPGWRTERGEVYIRLGEPDDVFDTNGLTQTRVIRWTYQSLRLTLYFRDDSGFNRYRLTPESRTEFERVATRLGR